jgi:hypothetical protein
MKKIDSVFIDKWEPKYDEIASDQREYLNLIDIVGNETRNIQTITPETFERIINWKSPRPKGYINWSNYKTYQNTFQLILNPEYTTKMNSLVALPGIGALVASVILHFIFPSAYPIYDFRIVEVLNYSGYLYSKTVSLVRYAEFYEAVHRLQTENVHYDLRQIDRALFAFHKINFSHKKKYGASCRPVKKPILGYNPIITTVRKQRSGAIPDIVKAICEKLGVNGKVIERNDIIKEAVKNGLNKNSVLPADYCDNTQTGKYSKHSFLHSIGPGRYILSKFRSQKAYAKFSTMRLIKIGGK